MTEHALDAISLVPRERLCGHNETALGLRLRWLKCSLLLTSTKNIV
ncbi:hypothetical protein ACVMGC_003678 [Bradyrhizobium barranii subsp. barranii]